MRWFLKFFFVLITALVLLSVVDRFLFSFGKMQLLGLWMMQEHASGLPFKAEQIVANNKAKFAPEIADMLSVPNQDTLTNQVALAFAPQVQEYPQVIAKLILVAKDHPQQSVRCQWQEQLGQGYQVTMINDPDNQAEVSHYLMMPEANCPAKDITNLKQQ